VVDETNPTALWVGGQQGAEVPFSCSKPNMADGATYRVTANVYTCQDVLTITGGSKLVFDDAVSE